MAKVVIEFDVPSDENAKLEFIKDALENVRISMWNDGKAQGEIQGWAGEVIGSFSIVE